MSESMLSAQLVAALPWWRCTFDAIGTAALAVPGCPKCMRPLPNIEPRSCLACNWKEDHRA